MRKWEMILGLCLCTSLLHAKTVTVSLDGSQDFTSIRQAVEQSDSGDTIILYPGTYRGVKNCGIDISARHLQSLSPTDPNCVKNTVVDCEIVYKTASSKQEGSAFFITELSIVSVSGITFTHHETDSSGVILVNSRASTPCILSIIHCRFINNRARIGAAIDSGYSQCSIKNTQFINNAASEAGGAIAIGPYHPSHITHCLFQGNHAPTGGAILSSANDLTIQGCTFLANIATGEGAVIAGHQQYSANALLSHSILWGNRLIRSNSDESNLESLISSKMTLSLCCLPAEYDPKAILEGITLDSDNLFADPLLVRNPSDGGDGWLDNPETLDLDESSNNDYGDWHLSPESPCIDAGDPNEKSINMPRDIDGQNRITGATMDMGCDEYPMPTTIIESPQNNETWVSGSSHVIQWSSLASAGEINLELGEYHPPPKTDRTTRSHIQNIAPHGDNKEDLWRLLETNLPPSGFTSCQIPLDLDGSYVIRAVIAGLPNDKQHIISSARFGLTSPNSDPLLGEAIPWSTSEGNVQRTGMSQYAGPDASLSGMTLELTDATGNTFRESAQTGIAVASEDRIYVPVGKVLNVYQLQTTLTTHRLRRLWQFQANAMITCTPTISPRGQVYFGDEEGTLFALNQDGTLAWTFSTGSPITGSPAINENEDVFFGSMNGSLYALGHNGGLRWSFQTENEDQSPTALLASPSITPDGLVIIGALHAPNLYALDPELGIPVWTHAFDLETYPITTPVISNDQVYLILSNGELQAINTRTGSTNWSMDLMSLMETQPKHAILWPCPAAASDGTIFVTLDGPDIHAITAHGTLKWTTSVNYAQTPALSVDAFDRLYAAGSYGSEYEAWAGVPWPYYGYMGNISMIDKTGLVTSLWSSSVEGLQELQLGRPILLDQQRVLMIGKFPRNLPLLPQPEKLFIGTPTNPR